MHHFFRLFQMSLSSFKDKIHVLPFSGVNVHRKIVNDPYHKLFRSDINYPANGTIDFSVL